MPPSQLVLLPLTLGHLLAPGLPPRHVLAGRHVLSELIVPYAHLFGPARCERLNLPTLENSEALSARTGLPHLGYALALCILYRLHRTLLFKHFADRVIERRRLGPRRHDALNAKVLGPTSRIISHGVVGHGSLSLLLAIVRRHPLCCLLSEGAGREQLPHVQSHCSRKRHEW